LSQAGEPFVTDNGNRILDCSFGPIADPARLEERIRHIVGVVESGLFISRADPVFVADAGGVHRLDSARSHRGSPPVLVIMGDRARANRRSHRNWRHASAGLRGRRLAPS
jgi:ribose 5-phosphate isomerase A